MVNGLMVSKLFPPLPAAPVLLLLPNHSVVIWLAIPSFLLLSLFSRIILPCRLPWEEEEIGGQCLHKQIGAA
jgi:hypothetical protein